MSEGPVIDDEYFQEMSLFTEKEGDALNEAAASYIGIMKGKPFREPSSKIWIHCRKGLSRSLPPVFK